MSASRSGRRLALLEVLSIFALILLYIWFIHSAWRWAWVAILALVIGSNAVHGERPRNIGLDTAQLLPAIRRLGPIVILIAFGWLAAGLALHSIRQLPIRYAIGGFVLYCGWGLLQQYLLNGFLVNRLRDAVGRRWAPALAAVAFAAVHAPNVFLAIVTLIGGYAAGLAYLRYRNLIILGLAHGLLGFMIYLTVPDSISMHLYVGPGCVEYMRRTGFKLWAP